MEYMIGAASVIVVWISLTILAGWAIEEPKKIRANAPRIWVLGFATGVVLVLLMLLPRWIR